MLKGRSVRKYKGKAFPLGQRVAFLTLNENSRIKNVYKYSDTSLLFPCFCFLVSYPTMRQLLKFSKNTGSKQKIAVTNLRPCVFSVSPTARDFHLCEKLVCIAPREDISC